MLKDAIHCWRRAPVYAATVALVMALVVLANAMAFSAVWGALYKPLPYRDAQALVELRIDLRDIDFQVGLSHAMYAQIRQSAEFSGAVGSAEAWQPRLDDSGTPWRVERVTPDFTAVLGVEPAFGRPLVASADGGLLISDRTWRQRFGADPDVLGSRLRIGTTDFTVVGVMPTGFGWPDSGADAWTTYAASTAESEQELAGGFGAFHVAARLAPGVGADQARARLEGILRTTGGPFLRDNAAIARPDLRPWRSRFTAGAVQPLLLLQAAALLLLIVAAANIASLTVERVTARRSEFALRLALGAERKNLAQAVAADLLPPAAVGTLVGLALVVPMLALVRTRGLLPDDLLAPSGLEWPMLLAGLLAAAVVVFAAVLAGALIASSGSRRTAAQAQSRRGPSLRGAMLMTQIAVATALCGSAGLLLRSALALDNEARGFEAAGVLMTQVDLSAVEQTDGATAEEDGAVAALQRLREAIEQLPGVTHVAQADMPPFGGAEFKITVQTPQTDAPAEVRVASVDAGYFDAMGMPLLAGEVFAAGAQSQVVPVIVDELFRQRWLPTGAVLGSSISLLQPDAPAIEARVIGIVPTVKQRALSEPGHPMIYLLATADAAGSFLITRTQADPAGLATAVQREIQRIAPGAVLMFHQPLATAIAKSTAAARSLTEVAVLLGSATGLLCALGCFALVGAAASRRRSEVGLRMALGAGSWSIQRLVLRQGSTPIAIGVVFGLVIGLLLSRTFADRLFRIQPDDVGTWLAAALLIAALALIASWLPASRAARVPPTAALAGGGREI